MYPLHPYFYGEWVLLTKIVAREGLKPSTKVHGTQSIVLDLAGDLNYTGLLRARFLRDVIRMTYRSLYWV
jgi:hypothetical protein